MNKYEDDEFYEVSETPGFSPTDTRQPFTDWLERNINKVGKF